MKEEFNSSLDNIVLKLEGWFSTLIEGIPNFILAILILLVAYFIAKYVGSTTAKLVSKKVHKKAITNIVEKVVALLILIVGLFIALGVLNLSKTVTSLLAGAGVIGLVIGFALQDTLSNTVSGIIISFRDKIRIGNWVETQGFAGEITEINLKNFILKEADNNMVLLPNKSILENPLKNYSLTDTMRITVGCGVGYESDLEEVKTLTQKTITEAFDVPNSPDDVEFYYTEFGDSSINFICRFWINGTKAKDRLDATSKAIMAIKKAFDDADINIPFPIRTLQFDNKLSLDKQSASNS
ncbi:MAG: mechanosensitive ion channel [Flavobacteriaceae bacterium]|nr:mechanosensitive ion channel [Flavobacteriaceae bacterium]